MIDDKLICSIFDIDDSEILIEVCNNVKERIN